MFRNYLMTALRNLVRNRLYAAINVVGLSVAFAAALLMALFVRDEFSYDKWLPNYERIAMISTISSFANDTDDIDMAPPYVKRMLLDEVPNVEKVVRLSGAGTVGLRRADIEYHEVLYWGDADFFEVLQLPFVAGDPATALQQPDSLVLTRSTARKYFGTENAIGQMVELNRKTPMRVTGVMEDLPSNTHLSLSVIGSGVTESSTLAQRDKFDPSSGNLPPLMRTYVLLKAGAVQDEFQRAVAALSARRGEFQTRNAKLSLYATPVAGVHLRPASPLKFDRGFAMKPSGDANIAVSVLLVGVLIITVASINFINLTTGTATRRAIEIGVRKVSGAERRHLIWQFIGESLFYVAAAMAAALILAQMLLPQFNALLGRTIFFGFDPLLTAGIAAIISTVGLTAGAYPAFLLSMFRPALVLKGTLTNPARAGLRRALVTVQFSVLIALLLVVSTIYMQLRYAMSDGLRFDKDQVMEVTAPCNSAFAAEVRNLPGVRTAACSYFSVLTSSRPVPVSAPDGRVLNPTMTVVNFGYFELFGIQPLAGRLFSPDFGIDSAPLDRASPVQPSVIINEALMRSLGFTAAEAAVGQTVRWKRQVSPTGLELTEERDSIIIGVVPDFSRPSVRDATPPMIFWIDPVLQRLINIKLDKDSVPETVAAIDALWSRVGDPRPIRRTFLDQTVEDRYRDLTRQTQVLAALAGVAIFIGMLGLFGLSALTAEQRTKEIGVRKPRGARAGDVVRLLLWQFTKPVLWANVIAWPAAYFFLKRWLEGFADHIDLSPWTFLAASALALVIAALTVSGHAFLVARAQPVTALRYE